MIAVLVAVLVAGDTGPQASGWEWWQSHVTSFLVTSSPASTGGHGTAYWIPQPPQPCGVVEARPFDSRLLCPSDLGPGWHATDFPTLLLLGCQPWGRTDVVGLVDDGPPLTDLAGVTPDTLTWPAGPVAMTNERFDPAEMEERVVDTATPAAAAAFLARRVHAKGCRDLGHGFTTSEPVSTTVDGLPAVVSFAARPTGRAQTTIVAVGSEVLVAWTHGSALETGVLLAKAIDRVRSPKRQSHAVDVVGGWPFQCIGPAACARQDARIDGSS